MFEIDEFMLDAALYGSCHHSSCAPPKRLKIDGLKTTLPRVDWYCGGIKLVNRGIHKEITNQLSLRKKVF